MVSSMLAEDLRLLHQRQRTLLLPEIAIVRVITFSYTGPIGPNYHRATWKEPVDRCIGKGYHYKRGTVKLENLNVL